MSGRSGLAFWIAACLPVVCEAAPNLVPNGNFEAGNVSFFSQYEFSPAANTTEAQYTVRDNAFPWNINFVDLRDHTSGSGLYFVGNGSPRVNEIVWQSLPIPIPPMSLLYFEAFVANVCCRPGYTGLNSDPVLDFYVSLDGGSEMFLGRRTIPAGQSGRWIGISTSFMSGSAGSAVLVLRNANSERFGNDFALDDIFLGTTSSVVPAPATSSSMVAAMALLAGCLAARRRWRPA